MKRKCVDKAKIFGFAPFLPVNLKISFAFFAWKAKKIPTRKGQRDTQRNCASRHFPPKIRTSRSQAPWDTPWTYLQPDICFRRELINTELDKIQSYWKRSVFTLSFIIIHRMLEDQSNYAPVIWNPTTPGSQWSSLSPEQKYWVKSRLLVLSCINQSPLSRIGCDSLDLEVHF